MKVGKIVASVIISRCLTYYNSSQIYNQWHKFMAVTNFAVNENIIQHNLKGLVAIHS